MRCGKIPTHSSQISMRQSYSACQTQICMVRHVGPPEHRTISGASLSEIVAHTYPLSKQGRPNRSKRDQVFAEQYKKNIISYMSGAGKYRMWLRIRCRAFGSRRNSAADGADPKSVRTTTPGYGCCAFWTRFMACLSVSYDDFEFPVRDRVVTNIDTQGFHSESSEPGRAR